MRRTRDKMISLKPSREEAAISDTNKELYGYIIIFLAWNPWAPFQTLMAIWQLWLWRSCVSMDGDGHTSASRIEIKWRRGEEEREREREKKKKSGFFHPHTPPAIYPPWRLSIKTKERERDSSIVVVARQEEESKEEDEGSEEKSF